MRNQTGLDGLRGDAQPAKRLGGTNEISRLPAFHLEMVAAYVIVPPGLQDACSARSGVKRPLKPGIQRRRLARPGGPLYKPN